MRKPNHPLVSVLKMGKNVLDFNGTQFLRSNDSFGLDSTFTLIFVTQFDSITNSANV